ncbi:Glycosyltransferase 4 [Gracilaria domingensis]|nr:Glycosyltransferase 4 [Gracilaria domingensis]
MASRHLVYITLEYCASDLFSGNGVCARSHVRALASLNVALTVLCATPYKPSPAPTPSDPEPLIPNVTLHAVPLDKWFTTDRNSSHRQFARCAAAVLQTLDFNQIHAILAVDWTAMNVIHALPHSARSRIAHVPIIYLNFRVYSRMVGISDEDRRFYLSNEKYAVRTALQSAGGVMSLGNADNDLLRRHSPNTSSKPFRVILPMLRQEFIDIAAVERGTILDFARPRNFLVSLVRLSEDKGPHRFVSLLAKIQKEDPHFWSRTGITPVLCGAPSQPEYAQKLKQTLKSTVPEAVIVDEFLGPSAFAMLLQSSALNIHPALYEAYGMTIVEAAAMGCPSVVHSQDIGAEQLLRSSDDEIVTVPHRREQTCQVGYGPTRRP